MSASFSPPLPVHWVDSPASLAAACRELAGEPAVAVDTEFVRERTYHPRLGLVQLAGEDRIFLVDPLALADLEPLAGLLSDPSVSKVLHSCSEDLEVFHRHLRLVPAGIFDTQIGAALAGHGASLSYQDLVARLLGVEIPKTHTRTDWLRRPLSAAQREYAAQDVAHLLPAHLGLRDELATLGRLGWLEEEVRELTAEERFEPAPEGEFRRIRGHGRLSRRQLAVLQELAAWRDDTARRRDLPRSFVVRDRALLEIARRLPRRPRELTAVPELKRSQAERDGKALLARVRTALERPDSELPDLAPRLPRSPEVRRVSRALRDLVARRSEELGIPPELLATRRDVEAVLRHHLLGAPCPRPLSGWRRRVVGEALEKILAESALQEGVEASA